MYTYDTWGRQIHATTYTSSIEGGAWYRENVQYTLGGNIYHSEAANGHNYVTVADYVYDGLGRLVSESDSQGTV